MSFVSRGGGVDGEYTGFSFVEIFEIFAMKDATLFGPDPFDVL